MNVLTLYKNKIKKLMRVIIIGFAIAPLISYADDSKEVKGPDTPGAMTQYQIIFRFWVKASSGWHYVNGTASNYTTTMAACPPGSSPVAALPGNFYDGNEYNNQCACKGSCITTPTNAYYTRSTGPNGGHKGAESGVLCQVGIESEVPTSQVGRGAPILLPGAVAGTTIKVYPTVLKANGLITQDPNHHVYYYTFNDDVSAPPALIGSNPIPSYNPDPVLPWVSWVVTTGHANSSNNCS